MQDITLTHAITATNKDGETVKVNYTSQQLEDLKKYNVDLQTEITRQIKKEFAKIDNEKAKKQMFVEGLGLNQQLTLRCCSDLENLLYKFRATNVKIILSVNLISDISDMLMMSDKIKITLGIGSKSEDYAGSYKATNLINTQYDFFVDLDLKDQITIIPNKGCIYAATVVIDKP